METHTLTEILYKEEKRQDERELILDMHFIFDEEHSGEDIAKISGEYSRLRYDYFQKYHTPFVYDRSKA